MTRRKRERDAAAQQRADAEQAGWEASFPTPVSRPWALNTFTLEKYIVNGSDVVVPVIDGVPLFETLQHDQPGIPRAWVRVPFHQWFGAPSQLVYGRPVILDSECGEIECCAVGARITILRDTVIWDQINSVPDELGRLQFEFPRSDYEAELAKWPDVPAKQWAAPRHDR